MAKRAKVELQTCWETDALAFPIKLMQKSPDDFTVIYGKQVNANLSYNEACTELGAAIMHALACAGNLDDREDAGDN